MSIVNESSWVDGAVQKYIQDLHSIAIDCKEKKASTMHLDVCLSSLGSQDVTECSEVAMTYCT